MAGLDGKVHETPLPPSVVGVVDVSEFAAVLDAVGFRLVASLPAESCFPLVAGRPDDPSTVVPEQGGGRQSDCLTLFDMAQAFSALARDGKRLPAILQVIVIRRRRRAVLKYARHNGGRVVAPAAGPDPIGQLDDVGRALRLLPGRWA